MKSEEKHLLLVDFCARLPYGVICKTSKGNGHLCSINQTIFGIEYGINIKATERDYFDDKEEIKPYLRPMSSMTEEEQKEFVKFHCVNICPIVITENLTISNEAEMFEWLNKKMFDYRGLISLGSALEAPEGMYNN